MDDWFLQSYYQQYLNSQFIELSMLTSLPSLSLERNEKSTTEILSPLYRKLSGIKFESDTKNSQVEPTIQTIRSDYANLTYTLDNLESAMDNRMSVHEKQLLSIMKIEIGKMLEDVRKVVKVFNQMIKEKNFSQDLWETKNEMEYFKFEAFRLFQENKSLKRQISDLRQQIQSLNFQQKCQSIALKKLAKKLVKQKTKRNSATAQFLSNKKSLETSELETMLSPPARKRHESLYSYHQKSEKKLEIEKKQSPEVNQRAQALSTLSHSGKHKTIIKTEAEQNLNQLFTNSKIRGYSERVMLFNNQGRSDKIKLFKQKAALYKSKNLQNKIEQQENCSQPIPIK